MSQTDFTPQQIADAAFVSAVADNTNEMLPRLINQEMNKRANIFGLVPNSARYGDSAMLESIREVIVGRVPDLEQKLRALPSISLERESLLREATGKVYIRTTEIYILESLLLGEEGDRYAWGSSALARKINNTFDNVNDFARANFVRSEFADKVGNFYALKQEVVEQIGLRYPNITITFHKDDKSFYTSVDGLSRYYYDTLKDAIMHSAFDALESELRLVRGANLAAEQGSLQQFLSANNVSKERVEVLFKSLGKEIPNEKLFVVTKNYQRGASEHGGNIHPADTEGLVGEILTKPVNYDDALAFWNAFRSMEHKDFEVERLRKKAAALQQQLVEVTEQLEDAKIDYLNKVDAFNKFIEFRADAQ